MKPDPRHGQIAPGAGGEGSLAQLTVALRERDELRSVPLAYPRTDPPTVSPAVAPTPTSTHPWVLDDRMPLPRCTPAPLLPPTGQLSGPGPRDSPPPLVLSGHAASLPPY